MDIVYRYDPDSDALAIYFKKLGEGSVSRTAVATDDYDVMVDYSDDRIVLLEFISPTKTMGLRFCDSLETLENKNKLPFVLQPSVKDGALMIFFSRLPATSHVVEVPTKVEEFFLLKNAAEIVGVRILNAASSVAGF